MKKMVMALIMFLVLANSSVNAFPTKQDESFIVAVVTSDKKITTVEGSISDIKNGIVESLKKNNNKVNVICHYSQFFDVMGIISEIDYVEWEGRSLTDIDDNYIVFNVTPAKK